MSAIPSDLRQIADETDYPGLLGKAADEIDRLTRERDALLRACYRREGVDAFYTCHPASESYGHRFRSEVEVVAAIRAAAGLETAS